MNESLEQQNQKQVAEQSTPTAPSKGQLLKVINKLEKGGSDRVGILADVGVTAIGAAGAGAAGMVVGTTATSIPIITALTGAVTIAAAPVALVAGAAIVGGGAVYGITRLIKNGGFHDGKRSQLLNEFKEALEDAHTKEAQNALSDEDKTTFYTFLRDPLKRNLISPEDTQRLIQVVEQGCLALTDAYELVGNILLEQQQSQATTT